MRQQDCSFKCASMDDFALIYNTKQHHQESKFPKPPAFFFLLCSAPVAVGKALKFVADGASSALRLLAPPAVEPRYLPTDPRPAVLIEGLAAPLSPR